MIDQSRLTRLNSGPLLRGRMGMFRGGGLKAVVLARAFAFNTGGGLRIGGGALLVIDAC